MKITNTVVANAMAAKNGVARNAVDDKTRFEKEAKRIAAKLKVPFSDLEELEFMAAHGEYELYSLAKQKAQKCRELSEVIYSILTR